MSAMSRDHYLGYSYCPLRYIVTQDVKYVIIERGQCTVSYGKKYSGNIICIV